MWNSKRHKKKAEASLKTIVFFIFSLVTLLFLMRSFLFYPLQSWITKRTLVNPVPVLGPKTIKKQQVVWQNKIDEIKNLLTKTKIAISSVSASDTGFLVELKEGGQVIFSDKKPLDSQVSSLQLILSRLTIEGKAINLLDLRFDRPILVAR